MAHFFVITILTMRKVKTQNAKPQKSPVSILKALRAFLKRNRDIISIIAILVQVIAIIVAITVFCIENRADDEENPLKKISPSRYQMIFVNTLRQRPQGVQVNFDHI